MWCGQDTLLCDQTELTERKRPKGGLKEAIQHRAWTARLRGWSFSWGIWGSQEGL